MPFGLLLAFFSSKKCQLPCYYLELTEVIPFVYTYMHLEVLHHFKFINNLISIPFPTMDMYVISI